jgi:hypothetical protein
MRTLIQNRLHDRRIPKELSLHESISAHPVRRCPPRVEPPPWEIAGISRATFFRRKRRAAQHVEPPPQRKPPHQPPRGRYPVVVPAHVAADRDRRLFADDERSITAVLCGDPQPGRSALAQRQQAAALAAECLHPLSAQLGINGGGRRPK